MLLITFLFWLLAILQTAVLSYWAPDLICVLIFSWSIYLVSRKEKIKISFWNIWFPAVFGLGMASFTFFSNWILLLYFTMLLLLSAFILKKSQWVLRWKEGFFSCAFILFIFFWSTILVKTQIFNYSITIDFIIRFILTSSICLSIWAYFVVVSKRGKIR